VAGFTNGFMVPSARRAVSSELYPDAFRANRTPADAPSLTR